MFKQYIRHKLEQYAKQYVKKHPEVKLVVVTGSVGKTSTKRALGTILNELFRVRMDENNHNTEMSAPLGILGIAYPAKVHSIGAWLQVFNAAKQRINQPADVDVIVQELGTDHPGDVAAFGKYLVPDIALVTAVTAEHMEFFGTMEAVAKEELSVTDYAKFAFINSDDVSSKYAEFQTNANFTTYGVSEMAEYRLTGQDYVQGSGYQCMLEAPELPAPADLSVNLLGEHSLRPVVGAAGVALKLGMSIEAVKAGVAKITPIPGRMNLLRGLDGTLIIDDTYNSSPAAAAAALRTLYNVFGQAPQRIALLGDMRELGDTSQAEHEALGMLCDGSMLGWVVTVGTESEKYLAPVARQRGCQVKSFQNPVLAAKFIRTVTEPGAVILAKGSQNTIFLEEAVKNLCVMTEDAKLVRQSPEWILTKEKYFDSLHDDMMETAKD